MGSPLDSMRQPEPRLASAVLRVPEPDTRYKDIPVDKKEVLRWLEAQLTEENTDKVIQYIGGLAKLSIPGLPVDVAAKVLDLALPGLLVAALDQVLD